MLKDNPKYIHQSKIGNIDVYICANAADYHTTRYIEALNWQIYAGCGITKDKITAITDEILKVCNEASNKTIKSDVISLIQVLKYSMKYPLDVNCGIHLGAVLSFIEYEHEGDIITEPETIDDFFIKKKIDLALNNPDAYTFFLGWGIANIEEYKTAVDTLTALDYLTERQSTIQSLLPTHLQHLMN